MDLTKAVEIMGELKGEVKKRGRESIRIKFRLFSSLRASAPDSDASDLACDLKYVVVFNRNNAFAFQTQPPCLPGLWRRIASACGL